MYENILSATREVIASLTTPVPENGSIAGAGIKALRGAPWLLSLEDNLHFSMGTSFLHLGLKGVSGKAKDSLMQAKTPEQKELLEGICCVYSDLCAYFSRYSQCVLETAGDDERLKRIAKNLEDLSQNPPQNFEQAVQLLAILWSIRALPGDGCALGRLDVYLSPFYERDVKVGVLSEDDVVSILCDFWNLINEKQSGDTLNNVMVGGENPDGTVAGGRLSALMLKATCLVKKSEPHINVRVHKGMREDVREEMLRVQLLGHGQATMYNDDVIIPGMLSKQIPKQLAYNYANDGCTEVILDGLGGINFLHVDAVACFELAFNNGMWAKRTYREKVKYWKDAQAARLYTPDVATGFASGKIEDCVTFDEFYQQFLKQYEFQVRHKCVDLFRRYEDRQAKGVSSLLLNGTFDFVLESGKDVAREGFPYQWQMIFSGSIPTVADCLVAIKRLVFEEKRYTVSQIKEAIRVNFDGFEEMRQRMLAQPKFGNDIDEVDLVAADIATHFCDWLDKFYHETDFMIQPALLGWRFLDEAYGIAATPDGRKYGDPIAEHYCATPGKAVEGPTAHIHSIAKAKDALARAIGVGAVHLSLPANLGKDDEEKKSILNSLEQAAFDKGFNQMNVAFYDVDVLRKAQKNPENYRDVIVRVWGYSARFVDLCYEMQEHVISRIANTK